MAQRTRKRSDGCSVYYYIKLVVFSLPVSPHPREHDRRVYPLRYRLYCLAGATECNCSVTVGRCIQCTIQVQRHSSPTIQTLADRQARCKARCNRIASKYKIVSTPRSFFKKILTSPTAREQFRIVPAASVRPHTPCVNTDSLPR